jgi:serine protein kinase
LIPLATRNIWLKQWISHVNDINIEDVELPIHTSLPGLSKRNQLIFENLLSAYDGDIAKVLSHVQVERFYYSKQYRVGVGTVEPQMSIDAVERQLTMDRNIGNLPPVLHNISFHEASGPLVEANRGILEFSDMLKRPIEAFKYLLSTVEKGTLNLPSSTANLDIVFFATTNEKHLDAFKTIPDFASFRSRFELITAPYLLRPSLEEKIYKHDIKAISEAKPVAPHTLSLLCLWAVLTRLKQPNPEYYEAKSRSVIARLDPINKLKFMKMLSPNQNLKLLISPF